MMADMDRYIKAKDHSADRAKDRHSVRIQKSLLQ